MRPVACKVSRVATLNRHQLLVQPCGARGPRVWKGPSLSKVCSHSLFIVRLSIWTSAPKRHSFTQCMNLSSSVQYLSFLTFRAVAWQALYSPHMRCFEVLGVSGV